VLDDLSAVLDAATLASLAVRFLRAAPAGGKKAVVQERLHMVARMCDTSFILALGARREGGERDTD
jgi:hypothetical protein